MGYTASKTIIQLQALIQTAAGVGTAIVAELHSNDARSILSGGSSDSGGRERVRDAPCKVSVLVGLDPEWGSRWFEGLRWQVWQDGDFIWKVQSVKSVRILPEIDVFVESSAVWAARLQRRLEFDFGVSLDDDGRLL